MAHATTDGEVIRVLHVDDELALAETTAEFLNCETERIHVETAENPSTALDRYEVTDFDCIVSDYEMPGENGIEFLETVRARDPELPFILYTGKGSEEIASEAISAGVSDYLQKNASPSQYTVLANRISNLVEQYRAQQTVVETEQTLSELAERSEDLLFMFNSDWSELVFINSACESIWGESIADLQENPQAFLKRIHPADREKASTAMELVTQGESVVLEYRIDRSNGDRRWIHGQYTPVLNDDGSVNRIVGFARDITEHKECEQALHETQAMLANVEEFADLGTYKVSLDTGDVTWSDGMRQVFEVSDDFEPTVDNAIEFYHPDERDRFRAAYKERLESGEAGGIDAAQMTTGQGNDRWTRAFADVTDENDQWLLRGFVQDITEHKDRERELERYEQMVKVSGDAMYTLDDDGVFTYVNDALVEITGYDAATLLGAHVSIVMDDAQVKQGERLIRSLLSSDDRRGTFEMDLITAAGNRIPSENHIALLLYEDEFEGTVGVLRDITDRLEREAHLQSTTARLTALYEHSPDMIDVLDTDGRLVDVNRRFCDELGYPKDAVVGRPIWEIDTMVTEAEVRELLSDFEMDERRKFEGEYKRRDNSVFPVEVHLLRLDLEGTDRFLAISRDITERKARERRLEQQNARLDDFASIVSHDLRNPLNVAHGYLELAREDNEHPHLTEAAVALDRMTVLIDDLLSLARMGDTVGECDLIELDELVDRCWETVMTETATLNSETDRTILADGSRLQQLLENLVRNAVEHGGSDVTVTVGDLETGFYVEDDGPGIPADLRDRIFDSGYSTSEDGTGFGLAIVKQIAEAHGWTVRSTTGSTGGARFEFTGVEFDG